jgi:hypothetical protein
LAGLQVTTKAVERTAETTHRDGPGTRDPAENRRIARDPLA